MEEDQIGEIDFQFDLSDWMVVDDDDNNGDHSGGRDHDGKDVATVRSENKDSCESNVKLDKAPKGRKEPKDTTDTAPLTGKLPLVPAKKAAPGKVLKTREAKSDTPSKPSKQGKVHTKVAAVMKDEARIVKDCKDNRTADSKVSKPIVSSQKSGSKPLSSLSKPKNSSQVSKTSTASAAQKNTSTKSTTLNTSKTVTGTTTSSTNNAVNTLSKPQAILSKIITSKETKEIPEQKAPTTSSSTTKLVDAVSATGKSSDKRQSKDKPDPRPSVSCSVTQTVVPSTKAKPSDSVLASRTTSTSSLTAKDSSLTSVAQKSNQFVKSEKSVVTLQSPNTPNKAQRQATKKLPDDTGSIADIMEAVSERYHDNSAGTYGCDVSDTELSAGKHKKNAAKRKIEPPNSEPSAKKAKVPLTSGNDTASVAQKTSSEPDKAKGVLNKKVVKKQTATGNAKSTFGTVKVKTPVAKPKAEKTNPPEPLESDTAAVKSPIPIPSETSAESKPTVSNIKDHRPLTTSSAPVKSAGPRIVRRFHRTTQTVPKRYSNKLLQCLIKIPALDNAPKPKHDFAVQTELEKDENIFYQVTLPDTIRQHFFKVVSAFDVNVMSSRSINSAGTFDYGISIGHVTSADLEKSLFKENILTKADYYNLCFDSQEQGVVDLYFADEEKFASVITSIRKTRIGPRYLVVTFSKNLKQEEQDASCSLSHVKATIIFDQNFATAAYITHLKAPIWNKPKVEETMTIHNLPSGIPLDFIKLLIPDAISIELDDSKLQFTQEGSRLRLGMTRATGSDSLMKLFTHMYINNEYCVFSKSLTNMKDESEMKDVLAEKEQRIKDIREIVAKSRDINAQAVPRMQEDEVVYLKVENVEEIEKVLTGRGSRWQGPSTVMQLQQADEEQIRCKGKRKVISKGTKENKEPVFIDITDELSDISDTSDIGEEPSMEGKRRAKTQSVNRRLASRSVSKDKGGNRNAHALQSHQRGKEQGTVTGDQRHIRPRAVKSREEGRRQKRFEGYHSHSPSQRSHYSQPDSNKVEYNSASRHGDARVDRSDPQMFREAHSEKDRQSYDGGFKNREKYANRSSPLDFEKKSHRHSAHYRDSPLSDKAKRQSAELRLQKFASDRDRFNKNVDGSERQKDQGSKKVHEARRVSKERTGSSRDRLSRGSYLNKQREGGDRRHGRDKHSGDERRVVRARSPLQKSGFLRRSASPRRDIHQITSPRRFSPSPISGGMRKVTIFRRSASPTRPPCSADLSPYRRQALGSDLSSSRQAPRNPRFSPQNQRTNNSSARRPTRGANISPHRPALRTTHRSSLSPARRQHHRSSLSPISVGDDNDNMDSLLGGTWLSQPPSSFNSRSSQENRSQVPTVSTRTTREDFRQSAPSTGVQNNLVTVKTDWDASSTKTPAEGGVNDARSFLERFVNEIVSQSRTQPESRFASNESSSANIQSDLQDPAKLLEKIRNVCRAAQHSAESGNEIGHRGREFNTSATQLRTHQDFDRNQGPQGHGRHSLYGEPQVTSVQENPGDYLPPPVPPPLFTSLTTPQDRISQMEAIAKQLAADIQKQTQHSQPTSFAQETWNVPPVVSAGQSHLNCPPPTMGALPTIAGPPNLGGPETMPFKEPLPYPGPDFRGPPPPMRLRFDQSQNVRGMNPPPSFWPRGPYF